MLNETFKILGRDEHDLLRIDDSDIDKDHELFVYGLEGYGCDQCGDTFHCRRDETGSKCCLHCGRWCRRCLDPDTSYSSDDEWKYMSTDDHVYDVTSTIGNYVYEIYHFSEDVIDIMLKYVDIKEICYEIKSQFEISWDKKKDMLSSWSQLDTNTCLDCEDHIQYEMWLTMKECNILNHVADIIMKYVNWDELSVATYNWTIQRVTVTCGVCGEYRSRTRHFTNCFGWVIICSRCKHYCKSSIMWNIRTFAKLIVPQSESKSGLLMSNHIIDIINSYVDMDIEMN